MSIIKAVRSMEFWWRSWFSFPGDLLYKTQLSTQWLWFSPVHIARAEHCFPDSRAQAIEDIPVHIESNFLPEMRRSWYRRVILPSFFKKHVPDVSFLSLRIITLSVARSSFHVVFVRGNCFGHRVLSSEIPCRWQKPDKQWMYRLWRVDDRTDLCLGMICSLNLRNVPWTRLPVYVEMYLTEIQTWGETRFGLPDPTNCPAGFRTWQFNKSICNTIELSRKKDLLKHDAINIIVI
jgi:hypothetical protein